MKKKLAAFAVALVFFSGVGLLEHYTKDPGQDAVTDPIKKPALEPMPPTEVPEDFVALKKAAVPGSIYMQLQA